MKKLGRRGFLKFMGAAPVAFPSAAQQLGSMSLGGIVTGVSGPTPPRSWSSAVGVQGGSATFNMIKKSALKSLGIPDWLTEQFKQESRHVDRFDPDIASFHSMSLSAKICLQRTRNRKRVEEEYFKTNWWSRRDEWQKTHGYIED